MKTRYALILFLTAGLFLAGCEKAGKTFEISGAPDPILYGHCNEPTLTFTVSGSKLKSGTLNLTYSPFHPAVTYIGSVTFKISSASGVSSPPVESIAPFGEGRVEFAATVTTFDLSPTGGTTYFLTSTKSVRVIPCGPTALPPGGGPKPTATPLPTSTATPTATATASPTPIVAPDAKPTKECNRLIQQCP